MPNINIRNLPVAVHSALRVRAAKAGRSMEAEARAILAGACRADASTTTAAQLMGWVDKLYQGCKPAGVVDDLIAERRLEADAETQR